MSLVRKTKPTWRDYLEASVVVQYHVYDVIMDGSFKDRLAFINDNIHRLECVLSVPTLTVSDVEDVDNLLHKWVESGFEGQMLRVPDSPYEGKRSKNLIKHKEFEDAEFEVVAIEEGLGNWAGYAKSDRKSTRLNSSHSQQSRMPSSA